MEGDKLSKKHRIFIFCHKSLCLKILIFETRENFDKNYQKFF